MLNIMYTGNFLQREEDRFLREFDLTIQQYNILRILRGQKNNPITVQGITERMLDKSSNASRIVDKLVAKKFAERKTCKKDRRQVEIRVLSAGNKIVEKCDNARNELPNFLEDISHETMQQMNHYLDTIRNKK